MHPLFTFSSILRDKTEKNNRTAALSKTYTRYRLKEPCERTISCIVFLNATVPSVYGFLWLPRGKRIRHNKKADDKQCISNHSRGLSRTQARHKRTVSHNYHSNQCCDFIFSHTSLPPIPQPVFLLFSSVPDRAARQSAGLLMQAGTRYPCYKCIKTNKYQSKNTAILPKHILKNGIKKETAALINITQSAFRSCFIPI